MATAADAAYDVVLHVVLIPLDLSGPRVARRVDADGHDVPADKLTSRYERIWPLMVAAAPHCCWAIFWDNATDDGPFEIGSYRYGIADYPPQWPGWTPEPLLAL